jgi:UDP-N-acetylmuramyl pentapeptide phosphotransferase/UDP-N-acetylglucosamine-1-phosphate transferase
VKALAACAVAMLLAAVAMRQIRRHALRLPHAAPSGRGLHERAVPRVGGLAILAGGMPAALIDPPRLPGPALAWLAALVAVAAVSYADDLRGLRAAQRFAVHAAAAALVAWLAFGATGAAVAVTLAIAWGANLYNFMDGSDGLAGTMAVTGFGAYALAAAHAGAPWGAPAAVAVATLPFLAANRPPASVFMGDVGAVPLGFAAAALGAAGVAMQTWPAWFPLLVFLPFVADATVTLGARALRGERLWEAHRSHFYQRLNLAGAGHRGTLGTYAAAMLACAALALACLAWRPQAGWTALAAAVLGHAGLFAAIDYHGRQKTRGAR